MQLIFAGTPEFSVQALSALLEAKHQVLLVLTQPDRPAKRGMALNPSPVKRLALTNGIKVFQPEPLKDAATYEYLQTCKAEVMIVAAYGLILPQSILDMPRYGCINIHASILPRWRGAAPIQRAILAGDKETGISIMQMEAGLDTGPVLLSQSIPITDEDTALTLHDKLAKLGGNLIVEFLGKLERSSTIEAKPQTHTQATYAAKIEKREAGIDWNLPAEELLRQIRAFNPFPGAVTSFNGYPLKIWQAEVVDGCGLPGTIILADRQDLVVACGEKALRLLQIQKAGGKRLSADQFLAGTSLSPGIKFDKIS